MRLILASLLALLPLTVQAQEENTSKTFYTMQGCDRWEKVAASFAKYNEKVLFVGDVVQFHASGTPFNGAMIFQVNQETGTWSLISIWGDGTACVTATGQNFEPYSQ